MIASPPFPPEVAADPRLISAAVYVAIAVVIVTAFPKLAGPLSSTWEKLTQGARRVQDAEHKADIAALSDRVELLSRLLDDYREEVEEMRREHRAEVEQLRRAHRREVGDIRNEQAEHNEVLADHASYDQAMIQLVIQLGGRPVAYKPLYPDATPGATPGAEHPPHDGGVPADLDHP